MIRVRKVSETIPAGSRKEILAADISGEVWEILKVRFLVPYNVFVVELVVDTQVIMRELVDESVEEIDFNGRLKAYDHIKLIVTNTTSYDYIFRMALVVNVEPVR